MDEYRKRCGNKSFDLKEFVETYFDLPVDQEAEPVSGARRSLRQHIEQLWDVLTRAADTDNPFSSLIPLPNPYIVPGGRFREIYYWDSYFTMLGLSDAGRNRAVSDMVENFAFLIDKIGFIPNGNRTYFCSRSQPPFFPLMVELLADIQENRRVLHKYLPQLRREYEFWMHGASELKADGDAFARVLKIGDAFLNRYWDNRDEPRAESYAEDRELAAKTNRDECDVYRDIRAACESGWDFSARWLEKPGALESIRTTTVIPIDLNSLLYHLEKLLADIYGSGGDTDLARLFDARAMQRRELLQSLFYDKEQGCFVDLNYPGLDPTGRLSIAMAYPLFLEIATHDQAAGVVNMIQDRFLAPGGWLTTLEFSGQQWDRPNGWAPMQWVVFKGLCNYDYVDEADLGAKRWVENNSDVYQRTGRLFEKYNVEHIGEIATGGEYTNQDGFGWTNAVLLRFMNHLGIE